MTIEELIGLLEGVWPRVDKGSVSLWRDTDEGEVDVTEEIGPDESYVDPHPEGSDRGGYVPYVKKGGACVFFYEPAGEWYPARRHMWGWR